MCFSMIKRIVDISEPAYLHIKNKQLVIDKNNETVGTVPVEDLGILILENSQIVLTQAVVIACQKNNSAIVFCDERHLPYSMILPISDANTLHNKILRQQVEISKPVKKQVWKQVVIHKIKQQSATLKKAGKCSLQLDRLVSKVKSGDPDNIEAQAAKKYWGLLFGGDFRRNINESGINSLLNYGYSVFRAMVARAIVGGGLHPSLGIFHQNQYNGLCLADDLMEPFRPWIDWLVFDWVVRKQKDDVQINQETKELFLCLPNESVKYNDKRMPLMVACHYFIADFKSVFKDGHHKLKYPVWPDQKVLL